MSRERWELAREVADAINRRDVDAIARLFHPEFEFHSAIARAEGGVYHGVEGMRRYFADIDAVWDEFRVEPEDVRDAEDQVVVLWRVSGRSRAGIPLEQTTGQVWTWRDGLPWRNESFTDPRAALEAVGLSE